MNTAAPHNSINRSSILYTLSGREVRSRLAMSGQCADPHRLRDVLQILVQSSLSSGSVHVFRDMLVQCGLDIESVMNRAKSVLRDVDERLFLFDAQAHSVCLHSLAAVGAFLINFSFPAQGVSLENIPWWNAGYTRHMLLCACLKNTALCGADISQSIVYQSDLTASDMENLSARSCFFKDCVFDRSYIRLADFNGSVFLNCRFHHARLLGTSFYGARFEHCSFHGALADDCSFAQTHCINTRIPKL